MRGLDQVLRIWRAAEVPLNPPASVEQLRELSQLFGGELPPDLHALYSAANGMDHNAMDDWNVSFWSIDRITREQDVDLIAERRWLAFADFLIYSWCFRISPDGDRTRVRVDGSHQEFDSLDAFLLHYARDPGSLGLVEAV